MKINLLQKFILTFVFSTIIVSCTKNENTDIKNQSDILNSLKYEDFLDDAYNLKSLVQDAIQDSNKFEIKNEIQGENYLSDYFNINNSIYYVDFNQYDISQSALNRTSEDEITLNDIGLSEQVLDYFNQLIILNENQDFQGMLDLLDIYKSDLDNNNNNDLIALSGVFATIEAYSSELVGVNDGSLSRRVGDCPPTGSQIAAGAINGAISGAIWGFKLGSFLGPAGTLIGTAGGSIAGAITGSILSIGVGSILNGDDC